MLTQEQLNQIKKWREEYGGHNKVPHAHALKALEEMVELCFAAGASVSEISLVVEEEMLKAKERGDDAPGFKREAVHAELGDVLVCLGVIIVNNDYDPGSIVEHTFGVIKGRQWAPDADGVLRRPR